jgi:hypothetical protein
MVQLLLDSAADELAIQKTLLWTSEIFPTGYELRVE